MIAKLDPYKTLGINRDASERAIRNAYRLAAKKAHPDTGGSPGEFEKVSAAHQCLIDPKRRAHFDATGDMGEAGPDVSQAQAMNLLMEAIGKVCGEIDRRGAVPESFDIIRDVVITLDNTLNQKKDELRKIKDGADKCRKLASRFKAKKGKSNVITPMLEARAADIDRQIAQVEDFITVVKEAKSLAEQHSFDVDTSGRPNAAPKAWGGMPIQPW